MHTDAQHRCTDCPNNHVCDGHVQVQCQLSTRPVNNVCTPWMGPCTNDQHGCDMTRGGVCVGGGSPPLGGCLLPLRTDSKILRPRLRGLQQLHPASLLEFLRASGSPKVSRRHQVGHPWTRLDARVSPAGRPVRSPTARPRHSQSQSATGVRGVHGWVCFCFW